MTIPSELHDDFQIGVNQIFAQGVSLWTNALISKRPRAFLQPRFGGETGQ